MINKNVKAVLQDCRTAFNEIPNKKTSIGYTYELVKRVEEILDDLSEYEDLPGLNPNITVDNQLKGELLVLTKQSDDKFMGNHPNQVYEGHKLTGWARKGITIGEPVMLFQTFSLKPDSTYPHCWTSRVISFNKDTMTLRTVNSTYLVEILDSNKIQ